MNVLIISGHPRKNSFSEAIVNAYVSGAIEAGVAVKKIFLSELTFNLNVTHTSPGRQFSEPEVLEAQHLILWSEHVVFVYPTWWGTMPALLKGFIDRVFTEGFAFNEIEGGTGYSPLLRGRSAQIITTMDTPYLIYQIVYRAPGHNAMKRAILEFCGFEMARTLTFSQIKHSGTCQRERWLNKVRREAAALKQGSALSPLRRLFSIALVWLKAIRLQFYPMTFIAYVSGALAAESSGYGFHSSVFWLGYVWLFFLEAATVLLNEYFDYATDKKNSFFGPFTGGSRVLVDKQLTFNQIKKGVFFSLVLSFIFLGIVLLHFTASLVPTLITAASLIVLALGYTVPPLKLSYRGLGELTVGITHSFAVVLCGYLLMGGQISDRLPWLTSMPLFFAVLPSIMLAGIPDYDADRAASKRTLPVRLGKKSAAVLALVFVWLAAAIVILLKAFQPALSLFIGMLYFVVPHAFVLSYFLNRYIKDHNPAKRIDVLILISLVYIIWFGIIPLINLS